MDEDTSIQATFRANVRTLLAEQNRLQKDLAESIGMSERGLGKNLSDNPEEQTDPALGTLAAIAKELDVPLWEILLDMTPFERRLRRILHPAMEAAVEVAAKEVTMIVERLRQSFIDAMRQSIPGLQEDLAVMEQFVEQALDHYRKTGVVLDLSRKKGPKFRS